MANSMSFNSVPDGFVSFEVELHKPPGARLGLDLMVVSVPYYVGLLVESASEGGVVDAWNRRNHEAVNIRPGDFIVRVNSVQGNAKAAAEELCQSIKLSMTVHRGTEDCPQSFRNLQASAAYKARGGTAALHEALLNMSGLTAARAPARMIPQQPLPGPDLSSSPPGRQAPAAAAGFLAQWQQQQQPQQRRVQQSAQMVVERAPAPEELPQASWSGRLLPASRLSARSLDPVMASVPIPGPGHVPEPTNPTGGPPQHRPEVPPQEFAAPSISPPTNEHFTFEAVLRKQPGVMLGMEVLPVKVGSLSGLKVEVVCQGGMVDTWNRANPPAFNIRPGDSIIRVNDVSSDSLAMMMLEDLCTCQELRITVCRDTGCQRPTIPMPNSAPPPFDLGAAPQGETPDEDNGSQSLALALPSHSGTSPAPQASQQEPVFTFNVEIKNQPGMRLGLEVMLVFSDTCGLVIKRVVEGGLVSLWNQTRRPPFRVQSGDYILELNGIGCCDSARMAEEFSKDYQTLNFIIQRGHGGVMAPEPCQPSRDAPSMDNHGQPGPKSAPGFRAVQGAPPPPPPIPAEWMPDSAGQFARPMAPPRTRPSDPPKAPPPPPPPRPMPMGTSERGWGAMPGLPPPGHSPCSSRPGSWPQDTAVQSPPMQPTPGPISVPDTSLLPERMSGQANEVGGLGSRMPAPPSPPQGHASAGGSFTQLFRSTSQLNDQELLQLFQESLHNRPWLRARAANTLGVP